MCCLLISSPSFCGGGNIGILPSFVSTSQQYNYRLSSQTVIDPVSRSEIESQFIQSSPERLCRSKITSLQTPDITVNPCRRHRVKLVKPFPERRPPAFDIFPDFKNYAHIVTYMLPLSTVVFCFLFRRRVCPLSAGLLSFRLDHSNWLCAGALTMPLAWQAFGKGLGERGRRRERMREERSTFSEKLRRGPASPRGYAVAR